MKRNLKKIGKKDNAITGLISGLLSGIVLGMLFKIIQEQLLINVYTLLLNIDFIPLVGSINWPEYIEYFFHIIVSILLGGIYSYLPLTKNRPYLSAFVITLPTIPLFYPLILLSKKETVNISDEFALFCWITGHLFFAMCLALFYKLIGRIKNDEPIS